MAPKSDLDGTFAVCFVRLALWLLWLSSAAASRTIIACLVWTFAFVSDIILLRTLRHQQKPARPRSQPDIRFDFRDLVARRFPPSGIYMLDTILAYLPIDSPRSADLAAEMIDAELPARRQIVPPPPNASADFLWTFWEVVFALAYQIPHGHFMQDKLAQLIVALAKRPAVLVRIDVSQPDVQLLRIWEGMTEFCNCSLGFLCENPDLWQPYDENEKLENWVNFQAFLARVQATGLPYGVNWAALALQMALEGRPSTNRAHWEAQLKVAALWVEHAGENMWWHVCQAGDNDPLPWPGRRLDEPAWREWARRFHEVACDGSNAASVRVVADDAFRAMARLAGSAPSRIYDDVGQKRWLGVLAERGGPDGEFDEPVFDERPGRAGGHFWDSDGSEDDEEDGYYVDPLRPPGGFLPYANLHPDADNQIARAA